METVNKEVKTLLAKLLATEDISVVHKNMPTAYFDTKNRELGLPILKNMTGDTYDMMTLHEVGHALWTDPEEWAEIVNKDNDDDLPKSFINVTEDVRIERKIKDKYPGGRRAFKTAYEKLYKDNFFGTAGRDISESNLADRINLHSKIGDATGLEFSSSEMEIYDLCKKAVTFKDAIDAARALYEYCKDVEDMEDSEFDDDHDFGEFNYDMSDEGENDDLDMDMAGESPFEMEGEEDSDGDSGMEGESKESTEEPESGSTERSESGNALAEKLKEEFEKKAEEFKAAKEATPSDEKEEESDAVDGTPKEISRNGGFGMGTTTNTMQADTVIEWEDRKRDLNVNDGKDYWYANLPESTLKNLVSYKSIINHYAEFMNDDYNSSNTEMWMSASYKYLTKFEKESQKTINYMLKEFEMKKSADSYVRASIAKTGQLDMTKVHSYKYNEDLFKKITVMPDGKNHGLVILIDWSGSMGRIIHDAFKQLMQIVWFCKRAGIKFEVFAFADHGMNVWFKDKEGGCAFGEYRGDYRNDPFFNYKLGDVAVSDHVLLNLFSDRMSKMELKRMANYLTFTTIQMCGMNYDHYTGKHMLSEYMDLTGREFHYTRPHFPDGMHLGGTPLNAAIATLSTFVPKYRRENNIQNLNVVVISDGASNNDGGKIVETKEMAYGSNYRREPTGRTIWSTDSPEWNSVKHYVDPVTKKQIKMRGRDCAAETAAHLEMLKARTGCNVVGFYLAQSTGNGSIRRNDLRWLFPNRNLDEVRSELRKNKVALADEFGYDEYYVIPTGNMALETEELEVNSDMTKGRMAKAFMKHMRNKTLNRVLLNKFVEKIV